MTENPVTALLILAFIALIAYLGNRNSNKKTIESTVEYIMDNNIVIPKQPKKWQSADVLAKKYERMIGELNEQS